MTYLILFCYLLIFGVTGVGQESTPPLRFEGVGSPSRFAANIPGATSPNGVASNGGIGIVPGNTSTIPAGIRRFFANTVTMPNGEKFPGTPSIEFNSHTLIGCLVVGVELDSGWYLYSQRPLGGYPTKITISPKSETPKGKVAVGPFFEASPVESVLFMDNQLEKMKGTPLWIAPIYVEGKIDPQQADSLLSTLVLQVDLDALLCRDGSNATCNPLLHEWYSVGNPTFDVVPLLRQAEEEWGRVQQPQNPLAKVDSTEGVSPQTAAKVPFSWIYLIYAFLGGLILNVMPCVLPVIGLKIISFFEQAGHSRLRALKLNIWYSAGIACVFVALALMSVGLSYLFTYGLFQIVMGVVVFAIALSLMGLWELSLPSFLGGKKSGKLMEKEGAPGAFFKGIITTLLAIPCGAPLLSPALVWSDSMIQQGQTLVVLAVYLVIALGMASPYLVVGAFPELLGFLPKPGLWMETFRITMGYILLTAVVWILFSMPIVLVLPMISLLFAIWFVCWFIGSIPYGTSSKVRGKRYLVSVGVLLTVVFFSFNLSFFDNPYTLQHGVEAKMVRWAIRAEREGKLKQQYWNLFEPSLFEKELKEGRTVMIDFTADWCMNCKLLESTVLHTDEITELVDQKNILTLTADWTNQNDDSPEIQAINALLDQYGGRQVPTIMIFAPNKTKEPIVLRGLFSKGELIAHLERL